MSENDPDPHLAPDQQSRSQLGPTVEPDDGDPTAGGKRGGIGEAPSIASDEPDDGSSWAVGGGSVSEETDAPPVADPGPDA
jgi:hypothetical protein